MLDFSTSGASIGLVEVRSRLRVDWSGFNQALLFQIGNVAGYLVRRERAFGQFVLLGYGRCDISWLHLVPDVELTDPVREDRSEGLVGGHRRTTSVGVQRLSQKAVSNY